MIAPAVEFGYATLKPESIIDVDGTEACKTWQDTFDIVAKAPGYQKGYFGRVVESPNTVNFVVEWDTVQAQRDFEATPEFKVFMTKFESLIQPVPVPLFFLYFDRSTISFITAGLGTTEVATFYNPSTTYLSKLRGFLERLDQSKPDGYIESAAGLSYEDDLEKEGGTKGKGKAVVLLIRWESRDAQKRFAQAEEWKDFLAEYFKLVKEEGGDTKMIFTNFQAFIPRLSNH